MRKTRGCRGWLVQCIFIGILIGWSTGVCGQNIVTGPSNTVALVGTQVTLNCSASNAIGITWIFTPVGGNVRTLCICGLPVSCPSEYNLSSPNTASCNLFISSVSLSMAGLYSCAPQGAPSQSAQLIVLASNPVCSTNISGNNITVGQSVLMSCNVSYSATASTLSPSMTWSGQPSINPSYTYSPTYVSSTLIVPVTSANIPYVSQYVCTTTIIMLSLPGSGLDHSLPPYSNSFTFPQLLVLYAPSANSINITGSDLSSDGQASLHSTLTCNAVTYPGAILTYIWTGPSGSNTTCPTITLSSLGSNLTYQCTATNAQGMDSNVISITVTNTTIATKCPGCDNSVQIGLIVGLCVSLTFNIAVIVLLCCCLCKRCPYYHKAHNDGVSNNQTNGRPIYVNASADHRLPCQDVPPSNYQELNSVVKNTGARENTEHVYQDLNRI